MKIKISFFKLRYTNVLPLLEAGNFKLAQILRNLCNEVVGSAKRCL